MQLDSHGRPRRRTQAHPRAARRYLHPMHEPSRLDPVTEVLLTQAESLSGTIAVLDDAAGALTGELLRLGQAPAVWCDDLRDEAQVPNELRRSCPVEAVTGAQVVLWRLPKATAAVEEYAELIAAHADPGVRVIAAGRDKHLSRSMNTALARSFASVRASLGHRKARALLAAEPTPKPPSWPRTARVDRLDLDVVAHGATFSTNRLDREPRCWPAASTGSPGRVRPSIWAAAAGSSRPCSPAAARASALSTSPGAPPMRPG